MAELVFTDAFVSVDGVTLSSKGTNVAIGLARQMKPQTAFGDTVENFLAGLKENDVALEFNQDFAASQVDVTLHTAWDNGTGVTVTIRPTSGAVAVGNPQYSASMLLENYQPFSGSVGDEAKASATFKPADGTGLVRTTS